MPKVQPGAQSWETNIVLLLDQAFKFCNMFVCLCAQAAQARDDLSYI